MLRRLRIKNFKLHRDTVLEFHAMQPTVLIGTNSSGKSTVIEVLDFLSRCATEGLEAAVVAHGGFAAIRTIGSTDPIEIESVWSFVTGKDDRPWTLSWSLVFHDEGSGRVLVRSESLHDKKRSLVSTNADGVRVVMDESEPESEPSSIKNTKLLAFEALVDENRYPGLAWLKFIVQETRVLGALSSVPAWARATRDRASPRDSLVISTESYVGREGLGLANALYNLHIDHTEEWGTLERAFRSEFPFVKRFVFPPDPGGSRISFAIEDERFPGRKVYASEMSDGMIVFLCLLSLIVHPSQIAVLALDEPDSHLHPSAVRRLLSLASAPHNKRNLIIVTHSNAILDELQDPATSIRVVEATRRGATIRTLEKEALAAWRNEYSLSELRRTGLLDSNNSAYGINE